MFFLEFIYLFLHRYIYKKRLDKQIRFSDRYVISIGNLSAGGTGKTPVTAAIAEVFKSQKPLAVLRGYGGKLKEPLLVSRGRGPLVTADEAGDEAVLLSSVKGLRVAAGKNRGEVIRKFSGDSKLILLDDAFQNPSVFRNHELVLIDSTIPPDSIRVFPSGHFRDNIRALSKADTVLLTRTDQITRGELLAWKKILKISVPHCEVFESIHMPEKIKPVLKSKRIGAFCAIGNSGSFFSLLEKLGYELIKTKAWKDHHGFTDSDISELLQWKIPLVTTSKDYARLSEKHKKRMKNLHVLNIKIKIVKDEKKFYKRIMNGKPL